VGIEPKMMSKAQKLLILLNAKNAKNTESAQAGYTAGTRQPGIFDATGVCATSCGAQGAVGDRSAATRRTERGRSHEFRRFWCRMIPCADLGAAHRDGSIPLV